MSAQNKEIKFTIGADESAFRRAQRLVREFTSDVSKAAAEVLRLQQSISRGGGGPGPGMSPLLVRQGAGAPITMPKSQANGPAGWLAGTLNDNKQLLSTIASASKESLKEMTRGVNEEVQRQRTHLRWLKKDVDELAASYAHLKDLEKRGISPADPDALQGHWNALQGARGNLRMGEDRLGQLEFAQGRMKPSRWDAAKDVIGDLAQGKRPSAESMQQLGTVAMVGAVAATVGKVVAANIKSGVMESEVAPYDFIGRAQRQGGSYGHAAMALKGGDMSLMQAIRLMRSNEQFSKDFDALSNGTGPTSGFAEGTSGGIAFDKSGWRKDKAVLGSWWNNKWSAVGQFDETKRKLDNAPVDMTVEQLQYLQGLKQAAPLYFEARDQLYQNAGSDVGAMNSLGIGARKYKSGLTLDRLTGEFSNGAQENAGLRTLRKATDTGLFSREDLIGAFKGIEGVGGREAGHQGMFSVMSGAAGGLYSGAHIYGTSAMFGDPGRFYGAVQNAVGRSSGGMDVAAANRMGMTAAGSLMSGAATTSGMGLLGAMNEYGRSYASGAGDMRIQSFMPQGLQAMGSVTGGGFDAYQSGSNLLNAVQSMPNGSIQAQEFLAQLDPRVMFDILGAGPNAPMPPELRARGITYDMVKAYSDKTMARTYDRNIGGNPLQGGKMDPMQQQTHDVMTKFGGDFKAYFEAGRKGLKGKERAIWEAQAFAERGAFMNSAYGVSDLAGQSFARLEAGRGAWGTGPRVAGRGAGPAAAGSVEAEDMAARSQEQGRLEHVRESNAADIKGDIKTRGTTGAAGALGDIGNVIGASADRAAAAFTKIALAAENAAAALNRVAAKAQAR